MSEYDYLLHKSERTPVGKSEVWINGVQHWIKASKIPKPVVREVLREDLDKPLSRRIVYRQRKNRPLRMYKIGAQKQNPNRQRAESQKMSRMLNDHTNVAPGVTRMPHNPDMGSMAFDARGPGEQTRRGQVHFSRDLERFPPHSPSQTMRHELRHLDQPMSGRKGQTVKIAQDQRPKAAGSRGGFKGEAMRRMQMKQRSEAWADVGSHGTSGHSNDAFPEAALAYGRARRRMSQGILGKPDKMVVRRGLNGAPRPLDDAEMARLGRRTRTRYRRKPQ